MLVFVTPHQFMEGICKSLVGKIKGDVEAISLIKGMEVKMEGPCMISTLISQQLGTNCCVLMGANIANEVINTIFNCSSFFTSQLIGHLLFLKLKPALCRLLWRSLVKQRLDIEGTDRLQRYGFNCLVLPISLSQL
jgi:hypothetical protein